MFGGLFRAGPSVAFGGTDAGEALEKVRMSFLLDVVLASWQLLQEAAVYILAPWFFLGLLLAGGVMALVPADWLGRHLGGGVPAMLLMLVVGIPIYICASASTPVAAALILKGVSPGAALVFLLVGPATNLASLTVLWRILGRRAAAVYLVVVAFSALACGLAVDALYASLGWSAQAVVGQAAEIIPAAVQWGAVGMLLVLSFDPLLQRFKALFAPAARSCPTTCRTPGPGAPALSQACGPT
jgi:uncharacterized protein